MLPWNVLLWRSRQLGAKRLRKAAGLKLPRVIAGAITVFAGYSRALGGSHGLSNSGR